jgi:phosphoribosylformimino-5-aminoimidazole carboxamide ribotide isomerase
MILYPAIDLKDGACVRLEQGLMDKATVFNADPADQARRFVADGAEWLHVVDLNGAFAGRAVNAQAVRAILQAAPGVPVQLGGGIREMAHVEAWLAAGVERVVLGTVAVKNPELVCQAAREFPGRVAVGVDAKGGKVAVEGWAETTELSAAELTRRFADVGVAAVIYTDIDRDGLLQGVNVEATRALARQTDIPVIASGGVAALDDIKALIAAGGIAGAISGRALYDGRLDLARAVALTKGAR